jgi:hypothetical protein
MELISFALLLIASFLGLLIGIILSNMAIEEIDHVSKYLKYVNIILVPAIILSAAYSVHAFYSIIFSVIALLIGIIFRNKNIDLWIYTCLGIAIFISTLGTGILNAAIFMTIYGASIATIEASKQFKNKINGRITSKDNKTLVKRLLSRYSFYLLVGMVSYVVFEYLI